MSRFLLRPQVESLGGRCLPSGNPFVTTGDAVPAATLVTTTDGEVSGWPEGEDGVIGGLDVASLGLQTLLDRAGKQRTTLSNVLGRLSEIQDTIVGHQK